MMKLIINCSLIDDYKSREKIAESRKNVCVTKRKINKIFFKINPTLLSL